MIFLNFPETPPSELSGALLVKDVDFHVTENCKNHHTDQFHIVENGTLVIRRGQPFMVTLSFNEEFDASKHELKFMFLIGKYFFSNIRKYFSGPNQEQYKCTGGSGIDEELRLIIDFGR